MPADTRQNQICAQLPDFGSLPRGAKNLRAALSTGTRARPRLVHLNSVIIDDHMITVRPR
jgi:hypothetical protein